MDGFKKDDDLDRRYFPKGTVHEDEYFYGKDILFAPIYRQGETQRDVYLPEGNWIHAITKERYMGGRTLQCHAQIDEFIAFIREGSEVLECFE